MDVPYLVNRVSLNPQTQPVAFNGQTVTAVVDILEVELVDETGLNGSQTRRFFTPEDIAAAQVVYVQGETITLTM